MRWSRSIAYRRAACMRRSLHMVTIAELPRPFSRDAQRRNPMEMAHAAQERVRPAVRPVKSSVPPTWSPSFMSTKSHWLF